MIFLFNDSYKRRRCQSLPGTAYPLPCQALLRSTTATRLNTILYWYP